MHKPSLHTTMFMNLISMCYDKSQTPKEEYTL